MKIMTGASSTWKGFVSIWCIVSGSSPELRQALLSR
jgi:hypothetical protein